VSPLLFIKSISRIAAFWRRELIHVTEARAAITANQETRENFTLMVHHGKEPPTIMNKRREAVRMSVLNLGLNATSYVFSSALLLIYYVHGILMMIEISGAPFLTVR
jgi:hypothetical protein